MWCLSQLNFSYLLLVGSQEYGNGLYCSEYMIPQALLVNNHKGGHEFFIKYPMVMRGIFYTHRGQIQLNYPPENLSLSLFLFLHLLLPPSLSNISICLIYCIHAHVFIYAYPLSFQISLFLIRPTFTSTSSLPSHHLHKLTPTKQ